MSGHGGHGSKVGVHHAILVQLAQVFNGLKVGGRLHVGGDGAILHEVVLFKADAKSAEQVVPLHVLRHGHDDAHGVLLAVAIGIVVGESVEHVVEAVQIGGHFKAQVFQPVHTHIQVRGIIGASAEHEIGVSINLIGRSLRQNVANFREDVGAILRQQVVQRHNHAFLDKLLHVRNVVHAEQVRQFARGNHGVELGFLVAGSRLDHVEPHAGRLFNGIQHRVVGIGGRS